MGLPLDYPRINQFPEWFTVDANAMYEVTVVDRTARVHRGDPLAERGAAVRMPVAEQRVDRVDPCQVLELG